MAPSSSLAALWQGFKERAEWFCDRPGYTGGPPDVRAAKEDTPHLVAAIDAVLALADRWDDTRGLYGLDEPAAMVREAILSSLLAAEDGDPK